MKRFTALLMSISLLLGCAACSGTTGGEDASQDGAGSTAVETTAEQGTQEEALTFTPGTYTGTASGYNGDVTVEVTFTETGISDIQVTEQGETEHVGDVAYDIMIPEIIEATGTGVDVVSGATFTSFALKNAVNEAAEAAGANMNLFEENSVETTPGEEIVDTYDVVIIGAGGAGMMAGAQAAQNGATVLIIEKNAEMGGNTLVSGGSYQSVQESLVWDPSDPDATEAVFDATGETVTKVKSDEGRLATLRIIANWSEEPFDGTIDDEHPADIGDIEQLSQRGVHEEYLETLQTLKSQIREYLAYADEKMAAGASETDLTVFSTIELHIFQTYYGGLRPNAEGTQWIYGDFDLVSQVISEAPGIKAWLIDQGAVFDNTVATTLIGCLWQRINRFQYGVVDGTEYSGKWGVYFKVPENTILSANEKNQIMTRTTATELIVDETGRVTGVRAERYDGTPVTVTATKGVILATGGYAANISMVMETNDYWSEEDLVSSIKTTNRSSLQGDGITMAEAVGAAVTGMEFTQLMPLGWVDNGNLAGGTGENVIYISPTTGQRYVDEAAERDVLSQGAFDNGLTGGVYIELSNGDVEEIPDDVEGRTYYRDLDGAAELLGIDKDVLEQTIREYDAYIIGTSDTPSEPAKTAYRGTIGSCETDEAGNYLPETYSINMLKIRYMAPSTHHTMGGLQVDLERHVLAEDGSIIPGLYAAGEVTGGIHGGNRLGGNAITEIIVSGRIAGDSASTGE